MMSFLNHWCHLIIVFIMILHGKTLNICDDCSCEINYIDCSNKNISLVGEEVLLPEFFKTFDLSKNELTELSSTNFGDVPHSLENLDMSSNLFEVITKHTFSQFLDLRSIDLSNNRITTIKENAFYNHSTLFELNLSFNQIVELPESTFFYLVELQALDLSFNHLTTLGESLFQNLNKMKTLDLSFLRLPTLHPGTFDWNLTVTDLDLSHNLFISVPSQTLWYMRKTLEHLKFSGNFIKKISDGDFMELRKLKKIKMEQWLYLREIRDYAFRDLESLESITLKYLPQLKKIYPKAFYLQHENKNESASTCPVYDFTLEFSILTTLPEELLDWNTLRQLSLKNNRWNCDCNLVWMKKSDVVGKLTESTIYCSYPFEYSGQPLYSLKEKDFTCNLFTTESKQGAGAIAAIIFIGILISFVTVAYLFHRKHGWLLRPPPANYDRVGVQANVITIYDRSDALDFANESSSAAPQVSVTEAKK